MPILTTYAPEQHSAYLQSFLGVEHQAFKSVSPCALGLYQLLAKIPSPVYEDVINGVKETVHSRIKYLSGLRRALPIGRYSYPYDVAWFHRTNESLVKQYLAEHDNEILSQPEESSVKRACDFKVKKLEVIAKVEALLPESASSAFFKPADGTCYEVSNYLRYNLLESLSAMANVYNLVAPSYYRLLDELLENFQRRLTTLEAKSPESSFALSAEALNLLNAVFEKQIVPMLRKQISHEENMVTEAMTTLRV